MSYSRRCAKASVVQADMKPPERTAAKPDAKYYRRLLEKALERSGLWYCINPTFRSKAVIDIIFFKLIL